MKNNEIGKRRLKLTANMILVANGEKILSEEFSISYERKLLPSLIVTSSPCFFRTGFNTKHAILYTTKYPIDIEVMINGRSELHHIHSYYQTKIMSDPNIEVYYRPTANYSESGQIFTWNKNGLSLFKRESTQQNTISITCEIKNNPELSIANLQSKQLSQFLSAFSDLPLVIISSKSSERNKILTILNGCINSIILPSIKKAAESVLKTVSYQNSSLHWNIVNNSVKKKYTIKNEISDDPKVAKKDEVYMKQTEEEKKDEPPKKTAKYISGTLSDGISKMIGKRVQIIAEKEVDSLTVSKKTVDKTKKEPKRVNTKEEYKEINYKAYLEIMNKVKMDELFDMVIRRRTTDKYVKPLCNSESLIQESFKEKRHMIDLYVVEAIISSSVKYIELLKQRNKLLKKTHSTINVILDTNCSLRKNKLRMRTVISCILVTVMRELGISFNLYIFCGRYKGVYVPMEDRSIHEIISFLFDMEEVVKMPSTPLDLLTIEGHFDEEDPAVIVTDGFSEQLLSSNEVVRSFIAEYPMLFVVCVKKKNDEALNGSNQSLLENSLEANFHNNFMIVEKINDLFSKSDDKLIHLFYDTQDLEMNVVMDVNSTVRYAGDIQDDLDRIFEANKSMVSINIISSTKPVKMVDISDENLLDYPKSISDTSVLRKLNGVIQGENLFDAMSISLFIPNKSTAYVAATSGTSIHMANYIKYLVSKTGDGKFFKKLGSEKIRSYNASIVIDCSSIAFSDTNRVHSLITIFTIIRNLSNMQLPCIDVWVASRDIIRVATGISSMDLWESNVIAALYESLSYPCQNTCLPDCIRYACSTCNARSFQSVMMILTNGVLCNESRLEIKSIVSGIEMTYLGIGIGLYLCGFEDLFPTMIWNSNPVQLSETLMNLTNASTSGNLNAVPMKKIDGTIMDQQFEKSFVEMTKRICSIPSIYETTLSSVRFNDATDGPDALSKIGDINSSKYDLGVDGAFGNYSILFIILYLCRGEMDEYDRVIDKFITEEVLMYGKEVDGEKFSPILKLGDKEINGVAIGKGFKIGYAYDYKTAINALLSGRYRMTFITCSPGDGIMAKKCDEDVDQYADAFVSCVHEFNMRGGGVFWFLENYPFTYEADLYFKKFHKFEAVGDKDKNIPGGKVME